MSTETKPANPPAFPQAQCSQCGVSHDAHVDADHGMELRDYFAAKAMQALIPAHHQNPYTFAELVAEKAYEYADAMLKEREAK